MSTGQPDEKMPADTKAAEAALESERGPGEKEAFNILYLLYANPK